MSFIKHEEIFIVVEKLKRFIKVELLSKQEIHEIDQKNQDITESQSSVTYVSNKFSFIKTLQYYITDCNILYLKLKLFKIVFIKLIFLRIELKRIENFEWIETKSFIEKDLRI